VESGAEGNVKWISRGLREVSRACVHWNCANRRTAVTEVVKLLWGGRGLVGNGERRLREGKDDSTIIIDN